MKRFLKHLTTIVLVLIITNINVQTARLGNLTISKNERQAAELIQSDEEKTESQSELKRKASMLLDEIGSEILSLKRFENRIIAQIAVASARQTQDEEHAKAMFRQVINDFNVIAQKTFESEDCKLTVADLNYDKLNSVRRHLVFMTSHQNAEMALEFLQQTRPVMLSILKQAKLKKVNLGENVNKQSFLKEEVSFEQWIAGQIAVKDPQQALLVARRALSNNLTDETLYLLEQLQAVDERAAAEFAAEIAQKLISTPINADNHYEQLRLITTFFSRYAPAQSQDLTTDEMTRASETTKQLDLNSNDQRDLAEKLAALLLTAQNNELSDWQFVQTMPVLEKLLPKDRTLALQQKHEAIKQLQKFQQQPPVSPDYEKYAQITSLGSPDQMLSQAANITGERLRNNVYQIAALKTAETGDEERARQIISLIPDKEQRLTAFNNLEDQLSNKAIEEENFDRARELIAKTSDKNWKLQRMIALAETLQTKNKTPEAEQLLDQARAMIGENIQEDLYQFSALASAYTKVAPEKAFLMMETMLERDNRIIAERMLQTETDPENQLFQEGELDFGRANEVDSNLLWGYSNLTALAAKDWERTLNLINRIERPDVRLATKIVLAQFILTDQQTLFEEGGC